MPQGSIISHFKEFSVSTADNKSYKVKMNPITRLAVKIFGIPHLGFRNRSRLIFKSLNKMGIRGKKILDAGAGYGLYSMLLAKNGAKVTSIDIDPERISEIEKLKKEYAPISGISTQIGSISKLKYKSESFDIVLCSEVLEHIKDDESSITELVRVTKDQGYLVLSFPTYSKSNIREYKKFIHERPGYDKIRISKIAKKFNLQIKEHLYYEYFFGGLAFKLHNRFSNSALVALLFYPFYLLSKLDILKIGEPNGQVIVFQKCLNH